MVEQDAESDKEVSVSLMKCLLINLGTEEVKRTPTFKQNILERIKELNYFERLFLFSILKRQRTGIAKIPEDYSYLGVHHLVMNCAPIQKRWQDYRKVVLSTFISHRLDNLSRGLEDSIKVTGYVKKKVFIHHYFREFIENSEDQKKASSDLLYEVFKWDDRTQKINVNRAKRGLGNIWYLKNMMKKSDNLKADLINFVKNDFLKIMIKKYSFEVERYMTTLLAGYQDSTDSQILEEFT